MPINNKFADFSTWLPLEAKISQEKLLDAISRPDTARGAVIASPSKSKPDYYFHWVRDAGLSMDVVVELYVREQNSEQKKIWNQKLLDFVNFSKSNQASIALTGLGEPKFYVDGKSFDLPWGRPQNDGPALRALTLIRFANLKLQEGQRQYVVENLYDGRLPSTSVIKADLEYVAARWADPSFDLWEEVLGDHYFTRIVQAAALEQGAALAAALNDGGASDWYLRQAQRIRASLKDYSNTNKSYIVATLNRAGGMGGKDSNLDAAVILGLLRAGYFSQFLKDPKLTGTLNALDSAFADLYPINRSHRNLGTAIGRYPEDVYDGDKFEGGNPWVLTTLAVAEAYYELAAHSKKTGNKQLADSYVQTGDSYFKRVQFHSNPDGSLSEQISRFNGYMTSAYDLTWNYAAVLTANWAREKALNRSTQPK